MLLTIPYPFTSAYARLCLRSLPPAEPSPRPSTTWQLLRTRGPKGVTPPMIPLLSKTTLKITLDQSPSLADGWRQTKSWRERAREKKRGRRGGNEAPRVGQRGVSSLLLILRTGARTYPVAASLGAGPRGGAGGGSSGHRAGIDGGFGGPGWRALGGALGESSGAGGVSSRLGRWNLRARVWALRLVGRVLGNVSRFSRRGACPRGTGPRDAGREQATDPRGAEQDVGPWGS